MWGVRTLAGLTAAVLGTLTGALVAEALRSRSWGVAVALVVVGIGCELLANVFVAGIVVSAFGGLVVVWSAALAARRGERVVWFGVWMIAAGCAGTAFAAPPPEAWGGFRGNVLVVVVVGAVACAVFAAVPTLNAFDAAFRPGVAAGFIRVGMRTIEQSLSGYEYGVAGGVAALALGMGATHALMLVRALRKTRAFVVNAVLVPTQVVVGTAMLSVAFSELDEVPAASLAVLALSLVAIGAGTFVAQLRVPQTATTPMRSRAKVEAEPEETTRLAHST